MQHCPENEMVVQLASNHAPIETADSKIEPLTATFENME